MFHAQIVVCPGINDGAHLERTVRELAALHPGVQSIGVVPVGLSGGRSGLAPVRRVTARLARELVEAVHGWQREFRKALGTRLVFAADEMYLLAAMEIPARGEYEGLWQLGNGIGGVRLFLDELARLRPVKLKRPMKVTLVTGEGRVGASGGAGREVGGGGERERGSGRDPQPAVRPFGDDGGPARGRGGSSRLAGQRRA